MKRGYFGIGIFHGKTEVNVGTLWNLAQRFGNYFSMGAKTYPIENLEL